MKTALQRRQSRHKRQARHKRQDNKEHLLIVLLVTSLWLLNFTLIVFPLGR